MGETVIQVVGALILLAFGAGAGRLGYKRVGTQDTGWERLVQTYAAQISDLLEANTALRQEVGELHDAVDRLESRERDCNTKLDEALDELRKLRAEVAGGG